LHRTAFGAVQVGRTLRITSWRVQPRPYTQACSAVPCPCAPTAAVCADPIPVFCRGEAEPSGSRLGEFSLAPTPRHAARCPAPAPRPRRSVPTQSLYFVGATLAPHCVWCSAGGQNPQDHVLESSASPLHPGMQRGALPLRANRAFCAVAIPVFCKSKNRRDPAGYFANIKNNAIAAGMMKNPITMKGPKQPPCSSTGL